MWLLTLLSAALFCFITFFAGGGLPPVQQATTTEIILTLGGGAIVAAAVILTPRGRRVYGLWPAGLLLAFAALSALSVVWSVQPDASWQNAGLMFAYSAVFGAAVALARAAPARWPAVIGGVTLAAVVVCGYALLTKVFPSWLDAHDIYARLQAPYGYWNATGLTAAIGVIGCIWLGARRQGHALLSALAYPAIGLLIVTLMLAYSRGALVALVVGLALWFAVVPLRLRGAAVLLAGALAAGLVVAWDFSRSALSSDSVALHARVVAGRQLGALLLAMLLLLALAGLAIGFATSRHAPARRTRENAGAILLSILVLAVLAFVGALAVSHRGLTGSISHGFHTLTNTHAPVPAETPGRLTAIGSVRAVYWNEALKVFQAHPALGAGARSYGTASLRYRAEDLEANDAHGFVVQTLADLGIVGLAIALALLFTWIAAAGRATHPFNRRWTSWRELKRGGWQGFGWHPVEDRPELGEERAYSPERIGMLSMLCLVVVFGVHSTVDWTWFVPGDACVALVCAGWLAGRGPLNAAAGVDRAAEGRRWVRRGRRGLIRRDRAAAPRCRRRRRGRGAARRLGAVAAAALGRRLPGSPVAERHQSQCGAHCRAERGRLRPGLGGSAVHALHDPAARRAERAGARDARARGAPAAVEPADVEGARRIRPAEREPDGRAERAARDRLPEPPGGRAAVGDPVRPRTARDPERLHRSAAREHAPRPRPVVKHVTVVRSPTAVTGIVRSPTGVKSVTVARSPAALAARRAALLRAARRRRENRNPLATR